MSDFWIFRLESFHPKPDEREIMPITADLPFRMMIFTSVQSNSPVSRGNNISICQ